MSFMLSQIEFENDVEKDYNKVVKDTKSRAMEMQRVITEFDDTEVKSFLEDGSWFNKLREQTERHESALVTTLAKVRNKINEGYRMLNAKIESLDLDVEKAAESELEAAENDADDYTDGSTTFHKEYGPDEDRNSVNTGA